LQGAGKDNGWSAFPGKGSAMSRFAELATLAEELAAEASKLKKRAAIAKSLQAVAAKSSEDAGRFALYLAGQPFAEADPRKLNAGGALLTTALKKVADCTDAELSAAYRRHGDLGAAAFEVLSRESCVGPGPDADPVTLAEVSEAFAAMAVARSTAQRAALVEALLSRAMALEVKYLLKLMLGDMRIGVKQSLVEEAIAEAAGAGVVDVRHAVMLEADLARVTGMAFAGTLREARMRLFHPLGFMLASPVDSPEEAMGRFTEKPKPEKKEKPKPRRKKASEVYEDLAGPEGITPVDAAEAGFAESVEAEAGSGDGPGQVEAFLEDKYDGMRAQIHCGDPTQPGRVAIYSRNREDITESYPELVEAFTGVNEPLIFDGEILGWDGSAGGWDVAAGRALPFSILGQRIGRKRVEDAIRRAVPVVFMAFDLLYEGAELLLAHPLRERRKKLEELATRLSAVTRSGLESPKAQEGLFAVVEEPMGRLRLSPSRVVASAEEIDQAYSDARERGNEGVMLKAAGSAYLPGRRGLAWLKLKRELATLDVVITGAEFGHGRRAGLLSDYTFAVRGPQGDLLNVGKAYSGLTDAEIVEMTAWLKEHTVEDQGYFRTVEPIRVLEVAFNNVMRSDRHASGFALRFPRILRIRDDKPLEEIDTLERVEQVYQSQPDKG